MASAVTLQRPLLPAAHPADVTTERRGVRWLLIGVTVGFLGIFLFLPLAIVFASALAKGFSVYFGALREPDALSAIRLTLLAAGIAVPLNLVFGVAAAWAIGKFDFIGKSLLITLIDLPLWTDDTVRAGKAVFGCRHERRMKK